MPRPRNSNPRYVTVDTKEMSAKIRNMSDAELGAWFRKAVTDLCSGCISHDVDPVIHKAFNRAAKRLLIDQNNQSYQYQKRKNKALGVADTREDSERDHKCGNTSAFSRRLDQHQHIQGSAKNPQCEGGGSATTQQGSTTYASPAQPFSPEKKSTTPDAGSGNAPENATNGGSTTASAQLESGTSGEVSPQKKGYGKNKLVMLTEKEGRKLRELYGADLSMAIGILDNYLVNNGKRSKDYVSHAAVLRRGNWVWREVQNTKLTEKRLENASNSSRSFRERERERMADTAGSLLTDKDREDFGLPATIYEEA